MWFFDFCGCYLRFVLTILVVNQNYVLCNSTSNSNFNASLRDYSHSNDIINYTGVKTLQKQDNHLYNIKYTQVENPVIFKDSADNDVSSSSYSRGFAHNDYTGYGLGDYGAAAHEGGGVDHYHHTEHEPHYYIDHGHHHKFHNPHALAVKTFLWPLAGIALLGAAAALVSNPILLQLGVVSGRRKRSTMLETTTPPNIKPFNENIIPTTEKSYINKRVYKYETYPLENRRSVKAQTFSKIINEEKERKRHETSNTQSNVADSANMPLLNNYRFQDKIYIPIPLQYYSKINTPKGKTNKK